MTQVIFAIAGLVLLTFAADHLVLGASRIAQRLNLSPVVVGVVIIGLGTSAPEFLVSGLAAAEGHTGIAVGNVVGSNILNLTLILGIAALIRPFSVASSVIAREIPVAIISIVLFGLLVFAGLTPITAIPLAIAIIVALTLLIRWAKSGNNTEIAREATDFTAGSHRIAPTAPHPNPTPEPTPPVDTQSISQQGWVEPVRAVAGLVGVLVGAQLLVANATTIAERLGVSQVVIGFTLVALGTSLPELVTVIASARRGETDLIVGNLFGSNMFNSLAGGAIVGFASGMDNPAKTAFGLLAAMVAVALLAWLFLRTRLRLTRAEGALLLAAYAATIPLLLAA